MKFLVAAVACLLCVSHVGAKTYFKEDFTDGQKWQERWIASDWKKEEGSNGSFNLTAGAWYGDAVADRGIQTSEDFRFYTISSRFPELLRRQVAGDIVIQYSVKHEQMWIECGGGYIKLLAEGTVQREFSPATQELLTFGPDLCGTQTKDVVVAVRAGGQSYKNSKHIRCEADRLTHFYTLILRADNTYEVRINGEKREEGNLYEDLAIPSEAELALDKQAVAFVGIEIWQVRAGTLFDNFLVTDSVAEAEEAFEEWQTRSFEKEKKAWERAEKKQQEEEERLRSAIEAERAKQDEELAKRLEEETSVEAVETEL